MTELLGYSRDEFLGQELWEIGFFGDKRASQAAYRELQEQGYVRYDHLPLEPRAARSPKVEFIQQRVRSGSPVRRAVQHSGH